MLGVRESSARAICEDLEKPINFPKSSIFHKL